MLKANISGTTRIFANEKQGQSGAYIAYRTSLGKKRQDGSYENGSLFVRFSNSSGKPQLASGQSADIEVLDGWLTFENYNATSNGQPVTDRNGKPIVRTAFGLFVNKWRYAQQMPSGVQKGAQTQNLPDSFAVVEDEPF